MAEVARVTVDSTQVASDLTNFPIYMDLADMPTNFWSTVKGGGTNRNSLDLERSSSQYASITDASQTGLDLTGDCTFEFWIKLEQLPSTAGGIMQIISKDDVTTNRCYDIDILNTDDKLRLQYFSSGLLERHVMDTAFDSSDVGKWVHIAISLDASAQTVVFYKNGSSVSGTHSINNSGTTIDDDPAPFRIGALGNNSNYFDGLIQDVRVWSDIRTSGEISANYTKILAGTETNLVGYWRFNNDYTDETSNANDLTASGSPVFSSDVAPINSGTDIRAYKNNANQTVNTNVLDLESSSSEYASITDAAQTGLALSTDFTLEAWINLEQLPSTAGNNMMIMCKDNFDTSQRSYALYIDSSNKLTCFYFDGSSNLSRSVSDSAVVTASDVGKWVHVAVSVDISATSFVMYKNGAVIADTNDSSAATTINDSTSAFYIGRRGGATIPNYFDGKIADVRVWSDIRTSTEIAEYYNQQLAGTEPNLVGYWKFDSSLEDSQTSGLNDLTHSATPTYAADPPYTIAGELPREVVSCDTSLETGELHVKYSGTLSSSTDTQIDIYADGTSADYATTDTYGRNAVWTNNKAVYHLEDVNDSSGNSYTLTNVDSTPFTTGEIGNGAITSSTNTTDYLNTTNNMGMTGASAKSYSFWWQPKRQPSTGTSDVMFRHLFDEGGNDNYANLLYQNDGGVYKLLMPSTPAGSSTTQTLTTDTWYHFVVTVPANNTGNITCYMNGASKFTEPNWSSNYALTTRLAIFADHAGTNISPGGMDEFRVYDSTLSANWISAEYTNQNTPNTFYTATAPGISFSVGESLSLSEGNIYAQDIKTNESTALSENYAIARGVAVAIAESVGLTEAYTYARTWATIIAENITLSETSLVKLLWTKLTKSADSTWTETSESNADVWTETSESNADTWTETNKSS